MPRWAGGRPPGASHLPRGALGRLAGSSSRRLGGGSCLLRVARRGAGAADNAAWHGATQERRGAGLGHEEAGASRHLLPPLSPRLSLHHVPTGQLELHRGAGRILPPPPKQRERSCSERGILESGRRLGRGSPGMLHPDRHYSYGRAVSDPHRLGCPVPGVSPCWLSPTEPSTSPAAMDRVDRR